jgi:lipopolysaccharide transport system permease protein
MWYFHMKILHLGWLYVPFILLIQMALALGLGLIGAALNVFYRDARPLVSLGLQLWFYASPIIYPVSAVPERFRSIYFLNPMVGVLEAYRAVLLYQASPSPYLMISAGVAITIFIFGYWFFKRLEFQFADVV